MSIDKLKENSLGLITFLKINDYSSSYIALFVREIQCITTAISLQSISSYEEYYNYLTTDSSISATTLVSRRQIIGKLQQYDLYGMYPSKECPSFLLKKHPFDILSLEFQQAISYFSNNLSSRGLMQSTIDSRKGMFIKFLLTVQRNSIYCFSNISEKVVHSYFNDGKKLIKGYDVVKIIRSALEINLTNPNSHLCIEQIIAFLPCIKKSHKIYPYLKDDEADKILKVIMDKDVELSLRDRAITILLYFTGLRRGDIASMSLNDIDWEHNIIQVVQSKTGIKNVLPLRPVVGNALYDYITNERPKCSSNVIFLTNDRNSRPI